MAAETTLVEGIRAACEGALLMGEQSLLVRTIVTSLPEEQDADFLQILTTESGEIVEAAVMVVKQSVVELYPPLPLTDAELEVAVEVVVRLVLSAITRPSKPPREAAADIAWIIGLALKGAEADADYGVSVGVVGRGCCVGVLGVGTVADGSVGEGVGASGAASSVT